MHQITYFYCNFRFDYIFLPFCICFFVVTGPALILPNGKVNYNQRSIDGSYPVNTTASSSCYSNYFPFGSNYNSCGVKGVWNEIPLTCQGYHHLIFLILYWYILKRSYKNVYKSKFFQQPVQLWVCQMVE